MIEDGELKGVGLPRKNRILPNEIFHDDDRGGRRGHLDAADLARPADRRRGPPARLVRRADQVHRAGPVAHRLGRLLHRHRRAGHAAGPQGAVHLAALAEGRACRASSSSRPAWTRPARPEGKFLYTMGGILDFKRAHDQVYVKQKFDEFEQDVEEMWPGLKNRVFIRRHFVRDPSFGVIQKPGLVGPVPAALQGPEHRRPLLRVRDVPVARHRRRPRGPRRAHLRRGHPRPPPLAARGGLALLSLRT